MGKGRCAACKHLRRKCRPDCIFSPYFPPNDPQRFACVHKIHGASNVGKLLQVLSTTHDRAVATDSLYIEAKCRIQDPVYGCVGIISLLEQQIQSVESQLAQTQADITILRSHAQDILPTHIGEAELNLDHLMQDQDSVNVSDYVNQVFLCSSREKFPDAN